MLHVCVNISDFLLNFNFREDVTPHVAMINSQDAQTVKHFVENTVWQLIHGQDVLVRYK